LVLNALSKYSWREFSDTNGRQVSDDVAAKLGRLMRLLGFDLPHAAALIGVGFLFQLFGVFFHC
jgi:hypothetical protein